MFWHPNLVQSMAGGKKFIQSSCSIFTSTKSGSGRTAREGFRALQFHTFSTLGFPRSSSMDLQPTFLKVVPKPKPKAQTEAIQNSQASTRGRKCHKPSCWGRHTNIQKCIPTYLLACLPTGLPAYRPAYLPAYLPTYLPTYLQPLYTYILICFCTY